MDSDKQKTKINEITPVQFQCVAVSCPAVYSIEGEGKLAIVGKKADPKELGIADRVGKDEQVVIVDRGMIEALIIEKLKRQNSSEDTG